MKPQLFSLGIAVPSASGYWGLLRSNCFIPSDIDLNSELSKLHGELIDLEAEMVESLDGTELLQRREAEIRMRSHHIKSLLSPIRRLPPEVLSKVFLMCMDEVAEIQILRLTEVCLHWREVALSSPTLW
ncbi:hypothetical protein JAAARDRAFT_116648, partial [Jaapia argillacea MUCL 33604]